MASNRPGACGAASFPSSSSSSSWSSSSDPSSSSCSKYDCFRPKLNRPPSILRTFARNFWPTWKESMLTEFESDSSEMWAKARMLELAILIKRPNSFFVATTPFTVSPTEKWPTSSPGATIDNTTFPSFTLTTYTSVKYFPIGKSFTTCESSTCPSAILLRGIQPWTVDVSANNTPPFPTLKTTPFTLLPAGNCVTGSTGSSNGFVFLCTFFSEARS
mmetsp:Transcript_13052/g.31511  ORF Transcript_13052/g.31511 Transcript_13052/m.31511 type:complete len:217 (+) Transcript_13052:1266-1916(+)